MGIKDAFKKEESISRELSLLPKDTKKRILENVKRRRNEILEEKILERQLKQVSYSEKSEKKGKWNGVKQGMQARREELKRKGIIKPVIRYNKQNFESPIEKASKEARRNEIRRLEAQRNKLKSGYSQASPINNISKLKLKVPKQSVEIIKIDFKSKKKKGWLI